MNFMKDAFGQCNLFQIKQIINPVLFYYLSQLDYKCLRYYFIFAAKLTIKIIRRSQILHYENFFCYLFFYSSIQSQSRIC
jgi:hypothetical protein